MHWIEKHIIGKLISQREVRAKDLKPDFVEPNLLTYYLQKLVNDKYVSKQRRGLYVLTPSGERLAGSFSTHTGKKSDSLKSCIVLYARNLQGEYLLFRWARQPYIGKVTFPHDRIKFGDSLDVALKSALLDKLGALYNATYKSNGMVRIEQDGLLISHMDVRVYEIEDTIQLPFSAKNGEAFWGNLDDSNTMQGLKELAEAMQSSDVFEVTLRYSGD